MQQTGRSTNTQLTELTRWQLQVVVVGGYSGNMLAPFFYFILFIYFIFFYIFWQVVTSFILHLLKGIGQHFGKYTYLLSCLNYDKIDTARVSIVNMKLQLEA